MSSGFVKDLKIYGLADLLTKLLSILCSPILTRLLSQQQFGTMSLLQSIWQPLSLARYGGMDSAYPFFKSTGEEAHHSLILFICSIISLFFTVLICLAFYFPVLIGSSVLLFTQTSLVEYQMFILYAFSSSLVYWFVYIFRFQKKPILYSIFNFLNTTGGTILTIPILLYFDIEMRLQVLFISSALLSFILFYLISFHFKYLFSQYKNILLNLKLIRSILRYGLILVPPAILYALSSNIDRILTGYFFSAKEVGILQIALTISSVGGILVSWFGLAFDPHAIDWIAKKDFKMLEKVSQKSLCLISFLFGYIICMSAIWSYWLIEMLYPKEYIYASILIPTYLFASYFSGISRITINTALIAMKPQVIFYVRFIAIIISFCFSYVAIPRYGIAFAPFSILISEIIILCGWVYLGSYFFKNLKLNWGYPIMIIGLAIFALLSPLFKIPKDSFMINSVLTVSISLFFFLPQYFYLKKSYF